MTDILTVPNRDMFVDIFHEAFKTLNQTQLLRFTSATRVVINETWVEFQHSNVQMVDTHHSPMTAALVAGEVRWADVQALHLVATCRWGYHAASNALHATHYAARARTQRRALACFDEARALAHALSETLAKDTL